MGVLKKLLEITVGPIRLVVIIAAGLTIISGIILWFLKGSMTYESFGATVCLLAALWVILRRIVGAKGITERLLFATAIALLVVLVCHQTYLDRTARLYKDTHFRVWVMYHYYMGSKYFDELGFDQLYIQTYIADRESPKPKLTKVDRIRDMADYKKKKIKKMVPKTRSDKWSPARWEEFNKDLAVFLPKKGIGTWKLMLTDRGYNPTPFWNTIGNQISSAINIQDHNQLLFATSIDMFFYAIIIGCVIWAFGIEAALLLFLAFIIMPFTTSRLIGGYLQYDWFTAVVVGVCLLKKRRPIGSALFFGFATMARAFPLILVAGLAASAGKKLIKKRKLEKFYLKFAAAFAIFVILGVIIGSFSTLGFGGWAKWKSNIALHNYEMTFGAGRIGLKHIFIQNVFEEKKWEKGRSKKQILKDQTGIYYVAAAFFFLFWLPAMWLLKSDFNSSLLAMTVMYILLAPSRYYWSIMVLFLLWEVGKGGVKAIPYLSKFQDLPLGVTDEKRPWTPALIPSLMVFIVPAAWYFIARTNKDPLAQYIRLDWVFGLCLIVLMASVIIGAFVRWKFADQKVEVDQKIEI